MQVALVILLSIYMYNIEKSTLTKHAKFPGKPKMD